MQYILNLNNKIKKLSLCFLSKLDINNEERLENRSTKTSFVIG